MKISLIVTTTKTEDDFKKTIFYSSLDRAKSKSSVSDIQIVILEKNKKGLCAVYNEYIRNQTEADIVTFIHDDVEIHDAYFFEKLIKAHEWYDVVGVAGAASQNYQNMKFGPAWHLCMEDPRKDGRGVVSHNLTTHINSVYFGPTPSAAVFVDGLLISFRRSAIVSSNITFDEDFTFHMYDLVTCLKSIQSGLKIGVWPFFLIHHGLGEFNNDPLWHKMKELFVQKYTNYRAAV